MKENVCAIWVDWDNPMQLSINPSGKILRANASLFSNTSPPQVCKVGHTIDGRLTTNLESRVVYFRLLLSHEII